MSSPPSAPGPHGLAVVRRSLGPLVRGPEPESGSASLRTFHILGRRTPMSAAQAHDVRQRPGLTLTVLAISATGYILLQSMVLPALPALGRDLHTSQSSAAWVLTAYLISASVATPVLGRLGDMFGKKKVLLVVLALLAIGSLIAALTSSFPVMLAARAG